MMRLAAAVLTLALAAPAYGAISDLTVRLKLDAAPFQAKSADTRFNVDR